MTSDGTRAARLVIRRPELAEPVLERVVAAHAARVDLPLDRLSDAQIASAAVAAAARRHVADAALGVDFDGRPGTMVLRIGPLRPGGAAEVVRDSAVPGVGSIVERLVDGFAVEENGKHETLCLTIGVGEEAAHPS